jgi:hypothetical protein
MKTEADTCRTYIVPKLHTSGWDDEYITEQMVLTRGRIVPWLQFAMWGITFMQVVAVRAG